MDQRSIVVFLHLNELSTKDVQAELVHILGSDDDVIACLTVTKYIRNDIILQNDPERESEDRAEDQSFSITDNAIPEAFEMLSFASIRQIVKMSFMPHTTTFRRLTKLFHFDLKRLR
jgi:hypothetical protein